MFESMMMRFQEDTARHLFRMQILAPDGTAIETAEQLAALQSRAVRTPPPAQMPAPAETHWQPNQPSATSGRSANPGMDATFVGNQPAAQQSAIAAKATTTIDALEKEFERNKQRDLNAARMAGGSASATSPTQRRTGNDVGRNDPCPCGSGKKYKKCHGANA